MKKNLKYGSLKIFSTCCLSLAFYTLASAQSYPYIMDFEPANTFPSNKNSYASLDTITIDSIRWIMPGVHLGSPVVPPGDFFNGSRSARIRLTGNTSGDPGYMEMQDDLPYGAGYISFNTAMYGNGSNGQLLVLYSTDSGITWNFAGDTINVPPNNASALVTRPINPPARISINIKKQKHNHDRIDIDDVSITQAGVISNIYILQKNPQGGNIPLNTTTLNIKYDHPIVAGNGVIEVHKNFGGVQSFSVPSSAVNIVDSTATISGLQLENATHYFVLMDDSVFQEAGGTAASLPLSDSTSWTFSTVDTTPPPPPPVLPSLQESFLACNPEINMMGVFKQYSMEGSKTWDCDASGRTDSFCVSMTGGWYAGASENSEDWLITALPLDLSEMEHPVLTLWQKKKYEGAVHRSLKISTDYQGTGNPLDSTVNWTSIYVPELELPPANTWTKISDIDLTAYKNTPFYLAFTYSCADSGAYILYYDDIKVAEHPLAIPEIQNALPGLKILGRAHPNKIRLAITLKKAAAVKIEVYDISGRKLYYELLSCPAGRSIQLISGLEIKPGIYFIRGGTTSGMRTVKAMVY
jgi:hypothetical protein